MGLGLICLVSLGLMLVYCFDLRVMLKLLVWRFWLFMLECVLCLYGFVTCMLTLAVVCFVDCA